VTFARRTRAAVATAAAALAVLCASAAADSPAVGYGERPMVLPDAGGRAADSRAWLLGTRSKVHQVPAGRARAVAARLRARGVLTYAEPDVVMRRTASFDSAPDQWARGAILPPAAAPPPPGAPIGIVDDFVDPAHPDVGPQTRLVNAGPDAPAGVLGPHGTMVASAAAGLFNGSGVVGVYPGAPILSYGAAQELTCLDAARGVETLVREGAGIINLSFGSPDECFTLFREIQEAYAAGRLVVASAGNEFTAGNPIIYPAAWPHVLSVAGVNVDLKPSYFSNENLAIDVAAPGQQVPVAVPLAFETDGVPDGVTLADGTSFSAPIVAGAAAWIAAQRPELKAGQIADVLRRSARDVNQPGYDQGTGFGLVNLQAALGAPAPRLDPLEPNDGITFVDGTAFGRPDPYVWRGSGRATLSASVDRVEDPVDVFRIKAPAKARVKIRLHPRFGDPDLRIYSGRSTSLANGQLIDRSLRGTGRTDVVDLVNTSGDARSAYVVVTAETDKNGSINAAYRLEFIRRRR
jgi:subtilisin family serine protease